MNWQDSVRPLSTEDMRPDLPAQRRMKVATVSAAVLVLLLLAALYAFNAVRENAGRRALSASRPQPPAVSTEVLRPQAGAQTLAAIGSLMAVHQVTVSAEVSGQITRIAFTGGEAVRKGEILVEMNVARERADLMSARAQLQLAALALQRASELHGRGNISQAQLDQAKSQHDVAAASVARAEAALAYKTIRAPFDGLLGTRDVEVGQYVSPGQKIAELTDLSQLYINFTIPEQERPRLAIGQPVELKVDAYPDRKFMGKLSVIDPQVDPGARTIKLQAVTDNPDGALNPGMYANALVVLPSAPNVITIPDASVMKSLYGDFVFVAVDDTKDGKTRIVARRTPVTTGQTYDGRITVVSGLKDGDRLIVTGLTKVADGGEITLSDQNNLVKPASIANE